MRLLCLKRRRAVPASCVVLVGGAARVGSAVCVGCGGVDGVAAAGTVQRHSAWARHLAAISWATARSRMTASLMSCRTSSAYALRPRRFLRYSAFSASSPSRSTRRLIFRACDFRTQSHHQTLALSPDILFAILAQNVRKLMSHCTPLSVGAKLAKKVTIRIDLEGKLADHFVYLKERRGLKNNSELVRMLISEEYQRQAGHGA